MLEGMSLDFNDARLRHALVMGVVAYFLTSDLRLAAMLAAASFVARIVPGLG